MKHHKKRNKKGQFRKARKLLTKIKTITLLYLAYKFFQPALEVIWNESVAPQIAQALLQ